METVINDEHEFTASIERQEAIAINGEQEVTSTRMIDEHSAIKKKWYWHVYWVLLFLLQLLLELALVSILWSTVGTLAAFGKFDTDFVYLTWVIVFGYLSYLIPFYIFWKLMVL